MAEAAKKFIFENSFDIEVIEEVPECDLEPLEPPRLYTEEQFQTAIEQAKDEAITAAKDQMTRALETQMNETITLFCNQIEAAAQACQKSYAEHFEYNAQLSIAILTKLFPVFFKNHNQDEIMGIISDHMSELKKANEIKICLSPTVDDTLKNKICDQFKTHNKLDSLTFMTEDHYNADQISLQWDESGIERNSETILENIINTYCSKN